MKIKLKRREYEVVRVVLQGSLSNPFGSLTPRMGPLTITVNGVDFTFPKPEEIQKIGEKHFGLEPLPKRVERADVADLADKPREKILKKLAKVRAGHHLVILKEAESLLCQLETVIGAYEDTKVPPETKARIRGLKLIVRTLKPKPAKTNGAATSAE